MGKIRTGKEIRKIIVGFVVQNFERKKGKFVCTRQEFVAGDQIDYEQEDGWAIDAPKNEEYFPLDMVQPK